MENDIFTGIKRVEGSYTTMDEKQARVVEMIKRYEVRPELKTRVNLNI